MLPVHFRRAPDDGMGRNSAPHEPSVEIIMAPRVVALVMSGPLSNIMGVLEG